MSSVQAGGVGGADVNSSSARARAMKNADGSLSTAIAASATIPIMAQELAAQTADAADGWPQDLQFILLSESTILTVPIIAGGIAPAASLSGTASSAMMATMFARYRNKPLMREG
jgi:hypothetical protein